MQGYLTPYFPEAYGSGSSGFNLFRAGPSMRSAGEPSQGHVPRRKRQVKLGADNVPPSPRYYGGALSRHGKNIAMPSVRVINIPAETPSE